MMTQGMVRMLKLCSGMLIFGSGMLTLSSGSSSSCSRSETKTEPAKGKINLQSMGNPTCIMQIFKFSNKNKKKDRKKATKQRIKNQTPQFQNPKRQNFNPITIKSGTNVQIFADSDS
jgi:hypothetical protein